ncbi:MAG: hypothetical protein ACREKS_18440 [Candidatus Rokuibacteriota bacterium]
MVKVGLVAAVLFLSACASAARQDANEIEPLLLAAGFQKRVADTPEKLAHLRALPALKMVPQQYKGSYFYVLPDPAGCRCMYVGSEQAFEQYEALAIRHTMAQDRIQRADGEATQNWDLWGPSFWP